MADPIVIVSAARTPIGGLLGDFSSLAAHQLGAIAVKAAVERAGVPGDAVDEVLLGWFGADVFKNQVTRTCDLARDDAAARPADERRFGQGRMLAGDPAQHVDHVGRRPARRQPAGRVARRLAVPAQIDAVRRESSRREAGHD